jgi:S1-C subfamily serine protease
MDTLTQGQRIDLETTARLTFRLSGNADRAALAAVLGNGSIVPLDRETPDVWHLDQPSSLPDAAEIVGYIADPRNDVAFTDLYPITVTIDGRDRLLPKPSARLGLVVLLETYQRSGRARIKVGGDGFSYGADAYERAKGLATHSLPFRRADASGTTRHPERSPSGIPSPGRSNGQEMGSGSGILVAPRTVITNAHVVDEGRSFFAGPTRTRLDVVAVDPIHDLAILRGDVEGECLRLRPSSSTWLGEPVIAAGYPLVGLLGTDLKVSMGNVSGLVGSHGDVSRFQFTAPIGSGSSGGAVTDEFGNLVGVTAAALAHAQIRDFGSVSENVNFAIKTTLVREILSSFGIEAPQEDCWTRGDRREAVARLRSAVVRIGVVA